MANQYSVKYVIISVVDETVYGEQSVILLRLRVILQQAEELTKFTQYKHSNILIYYT